MRAGLPPFVRLFLGLLIVLGPAPLLAQSGTIGLNFTGVTMADGMSLNANGGYAPPDNAGGVGPNHIVQLINGAFAVYDKSTGALSQPLTAAKDFWTAAGVNPGDQIVNLGSFNQRIVYDPTVDRWIAAGLSGGATSSGVDNLLMFARSDTSDPTGPWKAVSVVANDGGSGKFADFTMMGVDANGVYVSTNNFASTTGEGQVSTMLFSLPKADLLDAAPHTDRLTLFGESEFNIFGFGSLQPVTDFGPAKAYAPVLTAVDIPPPAAAMYRFNLTGTSGAGAMVSEGIGVDGTTALNPPNAGQPDLTQTISTIDLRIASPAYAVDGKIYTVHNTAAAGNAALTVDIVDEATNQLIQEVLLSDPNYDFFNGSIAANGLGDIVVGFTRSGTVAGGSLSAYALVGHTVGGVTTFGDPLLLQAGQVNDYHPSLHIDGVTSDRWGDWTTTVVDPSNPYVFWTFQEYALDNSSWATQITQITVPEPQSIVLAATAIAALLLAARRRRRTRSHLGV